eukprot:2378047-Pyramimonas_sp.AAC.1
MREPPEPQHPRQNLHLFGVQETNRSLVRSPRGRTGADDAHRDRVELRDSLVNRDDRPVQVVAVRTYDGNGGTQHLGRSSESPHSPKAVPILAVGVDGRRSTQYKS